MTLDLFPSAYWRQVTRSDTRARRLADRHYSRQSVGAVDFTPPGRVFVLLGADDQAVWACCENLDGGGEYRFRCTIFRREGTAPRASDLIRAATAITQDRWLRRWGGARAPLTTEIDCAAVRRKRDPGRCFLRAGWRPTGHTSRGLLVLTAPEGGA